MRKLIILVIAAACLLPGTSEAGGPVGFTPTGALYFNDATDTIAIDGQTVLGTDATYEAVVYLPATTGAAGFIFNEWLPSVEDKALGVGPSRLAGYNHDTGPLIAYEDPVAADLFLHVAYVKDQAVSEQRLYLAGDLVATSAASGDILDGAGQGFIGSIFRDSQRQDSFRGFITSFRISDVARYSGPSTGVPIFGDLADDASTLLLYNFNAPDLFVDQGQVKITDLSGNGHTGTLGAAGDQTATSPEPPAKLGDVDCSGGINSVDALKILRSNAALSVSQTEPCPDICENLLPALFGDVDCSGSVNSVDALKVLRYNAGLDPGQAKPCPEFGQPT